MKLFLWGWLILLHLPSVLAQDFSVDVQPKEQTLTIGEVADFTINVAPLGGFNATVFLSTTPTVGTLSVKALNMPYSSVNLNIPTSSLDTGTYSITINGRSGMVQHSTICTLTIQRNAQWKVMPPEQYLSWWKRSELLSTDPSKTVYRMYNDDKSSIFIQRFRNKQWETETIPTDFSFHATRHAYTTDKQGRVWITVPQGLVKYENTFITLYNKDNSPLLGNTPTALAIDRNDHLVCAFAKDTSNYIARFDGKDWKTVELRRPTSINVSWTSWKNSICVDKNNQVWIAAINNGVVRLTDSGQDHFSSKNSGLAFDNVSQIVCDDKGVLWFLHPSPPYILSSFDGTTWKKFMPSTFDQGFTALSLLVDSEGYVWVGSTFGLHRYNNDGTWTSYHKLNSPMPSSTVSGIVQDASNNLWLSIGERIVVFNAKGLVGIPLITDVVEQPSTESFPTNAALIQATDAVPVHLPAAAGQELRIFNSIGQHLYTALLDEEGKHLLPVASWTEGMYLCQAGTSCFTFLLYR